MHTREFLGWSRPLLTAVTDFLFVGPRTRPRDLAQTLVVVPTQQAGRRLREALAARAAAEGGGLWSPRVIVPGGLIPRPARPTPPATMLEADAIWLEVLRHVRPADFPALFPALPVRPDSAWALPLARALRQLRATLAEGGHGIADVAQGAGGESVEAERWSDLAGLEARYLRQLARAGRADPETVARQSAREAVAPEGITRILVAGVADLSILHQAALESLAAACPVTVLISAPAERAGDFDDWGRPRPDVWAREPIDLSTAAEDLALCAGPAGQARRVIAWLGEGAGCDLAHVAVGVPDPDVVPPLTAALAERGWRAYDPAGRAVADHPIVQLVSAAAALAGESDYAAFSAFARHSDVLEAAAAEFGLAPALALARLDQLQNDALPARFADIRARVHGAHPDAEAYPIACLVALADDFLADLARRPPEVAVRTLLQRIYGRRAIRPGTPAGEAFIEVGRIVGDALAELGRLEVGGDPLPAGDFLALLLTRLRDLRWYPERADAALDLDGWLELGWTDAPYVILTGINEGRLPETQLADLFLPDSLRTRLGLRDDAARAARDAFLLKALLESRREDGRLAITLGRTSAAGDPLKPSRLLFRCPDADLPARCRLLFDAVPDPRPRPAATVSFRLRPAQIAAPPAIERLRVTDFRGYLACPFRFYLQRGLAMETVDDRKVELDARDFGHLLHHALEAMARAPEWRTCVDEQALGGFLTETARTRAHRLYGEALPLPIEFQLRSAQQRLRAAARLQAAAVREGWELLECESAVRGEIGGLAVSGRIDRIERHRNHGRLRVLDYKTSDAADPPAAVHTGPAREDLPPYAALTLGGRERSWCDLQLPLYRLLLADHAEFGRFREVELGYVNLPKAVGDSAIAVWADFDEALLASARRCAEGVVADVRAGRFWPPRERVRHDEFERLFPGPVTDYVDPAGLAGLRPPEVA